MSDDDDERGGGTLVMEPAPGRRSAADADPATLLKGSPSGTLQMQNVVDPLARTAPPNRDFTPSGTQPIGVMAPGDLARGLPGLSPGPAPSPHPSYPSYPNAPQGPFPSNPSHPSSPDAQRPWPMTDSSHMPLGGSAPVFPREGEGEGETGLRPAVTPLAATPKKGLLPIALGAIIGLVIMLSVAAGVLLARSTGSGPTGSSPSAATATAMPAETPAPVATLPPVTTSTESARPAATGADAEAIAALEKLRAGIETCVVSTIHTLPGTSPPVPETLAWFKNGPYKPLPRDWVSPFFSCTKFKLDQPMSFMIQWQYQKPDKVGAGVAWIDENADGKPERAYAFTGKMVGKDKVEFTPIEAVDATKKVQKPR